MVMEAEVRVTMPQTKNSRSHQKLEEARTDSPLEVAEGAPPCLRLDFRLLASRPVWEFTSFKPPSLWSFVKAASGN